MCFKDRAPLLERPTANVDAAILEDVVRHEDNRDGADHLSHLFLPSDSLLQRGEEKRSIIAKRQHFTIENCAIGQPGCGRGDFREAEKHYKKALEIDGNYALAHFNLGNLYDERGDRARALQHYLAALKINSNYADAHYNLALLYQNTRQPMKAARHWRDYLKLDGSSSWAAIARRELDKIKGQTIVPGGAR